MLKNVYQSSTSLQESINLFWKILRGKIMYIFCAYLTPSVTSSGILYNRQMAEGTEP